MAWINRGRFWELTVPQMTQPWTDARQYRTTGGSCSKLMSTQSQATLADEICSPRTIDIFALSDASLAGILDEPIARESLLLEHYPEYTASRIPGLCVPNPLCGEYLWVPASERFMLLHIACSPDMLQEEFGGIAELKCPQNGLYRDVLTHGRPRRGHYIQMQANMGIVGADYCDYYQFTREKSFLLQVSSDRNYYKRLIRIMLSFIKKYIIPKPESTNLVLLEELKEYYTRARSTWCKLAPYKTYTVSG